MDIAALGRALTVAVGKNDAEAEPSGYLNTGYSPLNLAIAGHYDKGWAYQRLMEIYGPSASGKTVLATHAMIAAQRAGGLAIFIDWERVFKESFAREQGLNTDFPHLIYKRSDTWESGNSDMMKVGETVRSKGLIAPEAPIVAVMDSIAAAIPRSMLKTIEEKGMSELSMNDTTALARATSTTLKVINHYIVEYNMVVIYLNQIRTKPGVVYGDPTTTPGGSSMEFFATGRLALGAKKIMEKDGDTKEFKGRLIGMTTKKNKLTRPFQEVDLRLIYGADGICLFDFTRSLIDHLVDDLKILPKPKPGFVTYQGKDWSRVELAASIGDATTPAYKELDALLPR